MAYYTRYKLRVMGDAVSVHDVTQTIKSIADHNPFIDECSWYDHEKHMRQASKDHPGEILLLEGVGEDPGDMWQKYFKDGKMQVCRAQIVYPLFDETKLY